MSSFKLGPQYSYDPRAMGDNIVSGIKADLTTNYGYAGAPPTVMRLADVGLDSFSMLNIMVARYGAKSLLGMDDIFELMTGKGSGNPESIKSTRRIWREGKDMFAPGTVAACVTSNGTGLPYIELRVLGPEGNVIPWYGLNQQLKDVTNRSFFVVETRTDATTGQQIIKIVPADGKYDLVVSGGESENFPNGNIIGEIGSGGSYNEYRKTVYREYGFVQRDNVMSIVQGDTERDRSTMVNGWYQMIEMPDGGTIAAYFDSKEVQEHFRMKADLNYHMLFSERNYNDDQGPNSGNGLITQIPEKYRANMNLSAFARDPFDQLEGWVYDWTQSKPGYFGDEIVVAAGSNAFRKLQRGLSKDGNLGAYRQNRDIPTSFDQASSDYILGQQFGGAIDYLGYRLHFVHMPALDLLGRGVASRSASSNTNVSSNSDAMILFDPSRMVNASIVDGNGNVVEEDKYKIEYLCAENPDGTPLHYVDQILTGSIDAEGNTINGEVISFNNTSQRKKEVHYMFNVLDETALAWIHPNN